MDPRVIEVSFVFVESLSCFCYVLRLAIFSSELQSIQARVQAALF
jgi:hypothetical protein